MKIQLYFKTPDVVHYALQDEEVLNLDEDQQDEIKSVISKYVEFGEAVTIEFNTKTGEATVLPI